MKISVFGLGYVGCVGMGCLAQNGNRLIGVDINPYKVDLINSGKPTIIEKDIDRLIAEYRKKGTIEATTDFKQAIASSEVAFICVGTPSQPTGQLNLDYVYKTAEQIGESIKSIDIFYTVVIRSTVFPGTNAEVGKIIEKASGKKRNVDFAVVSNPEFLREGSAVEDYYNPAVTVIGSDNERAADIVEEIYKPVNAPVVKTDVGVAEMIKYVNNSFHALKVSFANEIGVVAKAIGVDANKLMDLFIQDDRLNISPAYLKPGMAYGGSCLPKDQKGLYTIAYDNYINTPVLKSISESNNIHKDRAFQLVEQFNSKKIGIVGLAFKMGTDDLRYSPTVDLVEKLHGKGYDIKIFDKNVVLSKLLGSNRSYIEEKLPHISAMLVSDLDQVVDFADTLILAHKNKDLRKFDGPLEKKIIIDMVGDEYFKSFDNYNGIAW